MGGGADKGGGIPATVEIVDGKIATVEIAENEEMQGIVRGRFARLYSYGHYAGESISKLRTKALEANSHLQVCSFKRVLCVVLDDMGVFGGSFSWGSDRQVPSAAFLKLSKETKSF